MGKRLLLKIIAVVLSVTMILLTGVACSNSPSDKTKPSDSDNVIENTVIFD